MIHTYSPLHVNDRGDVFLCREDDAKPECVGHIDEGCPFAEDDLSRKWAWLHQEWADRQSFTEGCRAAAEMAYASRIGDPSRW